MQIINQLKKPNILSTDDLTCNSITVTNTTPIENNELTSKIYVDNGLAEKQPYILLTDDLTCKSITVINTTPVENDELTSKIYVDNGLDTKQDNIIETTALTCNSITVSKPTIIIRFKFVGCNIIRYKTRYINSR